MILMGSNPRFPVGFPPFVREIIRRQVGTLGNSEAEVVKNIVLIYLTEQGLLKAVMGKEAKKRWNENREPNNWQFSWSSSCQFSSPHSSMHPRRSHSITLLLTAQEMVTSQASKTQLITQQPQISYRYDQDSTTKTRSRWIKKSP